MVCSVWSASTLVYIHIIYTCVYSLCTKYTHVFTHSVLTTQYSQFLACYRTVSIHGSVQAPAPLSEARYRPQRHCQRLGTGPSATVSGSVLAPAPLSEAIATVCGSTVSH